MKYEIPEFPETPLDQFKAQLNFIHDNIEALEKNDNSNSIVWRYMQVRVTALSSIIKEVRKG